MTQVQKAVDKRCRRVPGKRLRESDLLFLRRPRQGPFWDLVLALYLRGLRRQGDGAGAGVSPALRPLPGDRGHQTLHLHRLPRHRLCSRTSRAPPGLSGVPGHRRRHHFGPGLPDLPGTGRCLRSPEKIANKSSLPLGSGGRSIAVIGATHMSGEQRKRAAVAVVKVESRDDQVTPEASPEFVETAYVQDLSQARPGLPGGGLSGPLRRTGRHGQDHPGLPRGRAAGPAGGPDPRRR